MRFISVAIMHLAPIPSLAYSGMGEGMMTNRYVVHVYST